MTNTPKILIATGKTEKQIKKQVGRWFKGNPNRKNVVVKTDKGMLAITSDKAY